jgi:TatA/E family protein of Tat protein translocase
VIRPTDPAGIATGVADFLTAMFGPKKLPELGKGIGDGIRGFKSAMKEPENLPQNATISARADSTGDDARN